MALTLENLQSHVTHAVPGGINTPGTTAQIVNEAGRALYAARAWKFREHAASSVDIVSGQSYITLPTDFGELQAWEADGLTESFTMTTLQEILSLRAKDYMPVGFIWYGAIVHSESSATISTGALFISVVATGIIDIQNTVEVEITETAGTKTIRVEVISTGENATGTLGSGNDYETLADVKTAIDGITTPSTFNIATTILTGTFGSTTDADVLQTVSENTLSTADQQTLLGDYTVENMVPQIELYPTPTQTISNGIRIYYRREWKELVNSTDVPNVPLWCESLLIQYVRAIAEVYEGRAENRSLANMTTSTAMTTALASIEAGHLFKAAIRRDSAIQRSYGPVRNGAASMPQSIGPFDSRPVSEPFIT